eukprot:GFUD01032171.1.p1 GENE.GFUD01032171.1~~GFUD01032171.1.p1  ORF type:complete len:827 (-),score=161.88 GFUD01032171.1:149-2629(-)
MGKLWSRLLIATGLKRKAKVSVCSCSLDLGLHPFQPSNAEEADIVRTKFPSFVEELTKKTEENYFQEDSPPFKLFPPSVRPDANKLGHGYPFNCEEEPSKKKVKWEKDYAAIKAEQDVANQFNIHFTNCRNEGFLFQPFHTDTYLKGMKEKAKQKRRGDAQRLHRDVDTLPLSEIEKNICECVGVNIGEIIESGKDLDDKIDEKAMKLKLKIKERERFKNKGKTLPNDEDKKNYVKYSQYKKEVYDNINCEMDLIITIAAKRTFLEVEIKSHSANIGLKSVLEKAAKQVSKGNKIVEKFHGDILREWDFVRVIALPNINKNELEKEACEHCSNFLIGREEMDHFSPWIENLLSKLQISDCTSDAYRKLFARVVGCYSHSEHHSSTVTLSLAEARTENEKAITEKEKGVYSENSVPGESLPETFQLTDFDKKENKSVYLYWNPQQLELLLQNEDTKKRVLFNSSFGCGKTLLMKHFAHTLAKRDSDKKVFYISLAAAAGQQLGESKSSKLMWPAVFDIANGMDFENTRVEVIGVNNLIQHYQDKFNQHAACVNDLLETFMKDNPGHHFIDELPAYEGGRYHATKFSGPNLTHLTDPEWNDCCVWIALRPCKIDSVNYDKFTADAQAYREHLTDQLSFHIPPLSVNMRNSSSVKEVDNVYYARKRSVAPAPLPPNPVCGNPAIVIQCDNASYRGKTVTAAIGKYFKKTSEPVIIIVRHSSDIAQVVEECEKLSDRPVTTYYPRPGRVITDEVTKLKHFLREPSGLLVTDRHLFGGMQARNVICVTSDYDTNSVTRAIAQVIVIAGKDDVKLYKKANIVVDTDIASAIV